MLMSHLFPPFRTLHKSIAVRVGQMLTLGVGNRWLGLDFLRTRPMVPVQNCKHGTLGPFFTSNVCV